MVYRRSEGGSGSSSAQPAPEAQPQNAFRNDGSFLEMFKRMQEANTNPAPERTDDTQPSPPTVSVKNEEISSPSPSNVTLPGNSNDVDDTSKEGNKRAPLIGKRRGGRILPTGMVKKKRAEEEVQPGEKPKDAWSLYMAEVKRYKETSCEEDGKTRPLVK